MTQLLVIVTFLWAVFIGNALLSKCNCMISICMQNVQACTQEHLWIILLFWGVSAPQTKFPWAYWVEIKLISPDIGESHRSCLLPDCPHGESRFRFWCTLAFSLTWAPGGWRTWRHRGIWYTGYRSESMDQTSVLASWAGRSQSSASSAASWEAEPGLAVCPPAPHPTPRPSPACQREKNAVTDKTAVSEMPQHGAGAFLCLQCETDY